MAYKVCICMGVCAFVRVRVCIYLHLQLARHGQMKLFSIMIWLIKLGGRSSHIISNDMMMLYSIEDHSIDK